MKKRIFFVILIISFLSPFFSSAFGAEKRVVNIAGQWPFQSSNAIAIDVKRDLVFLGKGEQVSILNHQFNLLAMPRLSESASITGIHYDATTHTLYATCRSAGLFAINVSDPAEPSVAKIFEPKEGVNTYGVYVEGNSIFLACGLSGVLILDHSNTEAELIDTVNLQGAMGISFAVDILYNDKYLYVADNYNGIHIIHLPESFSPDPKKLISLPGVRHLVLKASYLYAAVEGLGLEIVDINDPENPTEAGKYETKSPERTVQINGDLAYLVNADTGLTILDITDKNEPIYNPDWRFSNQGVTSIAMAPMEKTAFILHNVNGLQKIDVADPANVRRLSSFDTPADASALDVEENFVFVIDDNVGQDSSKEGLRIARISISNQVIDFQLQSFIATPGTAMDIQVKNNRAIIADGDNGLHIFDVSDKKQPRLLGALDTGGCATNIETTENHVYIANGAKGLMTADISDPAAPTIVSSVDTESNVKDVSVSGNHASVIEENGILTVFDLENPNTPTKVGTLKISDNVENLVAHRNFVYVATGKQGVVVVDISDPSNPVSTATIDTKGYANGVTISGDFAYIADGLNGIAAYNISNPAQPEKIDNWCYNTQGYTSEIDNFFFNESLYLVSADGAAGLFAINPTVEDTGIGEGQSGGGSGGCFISSSKFKPGKNPADRCIDEHLQKKQGTDEKPFLWRHAE